jgi:hypothetical protein
MIFFFKYTKKSITLFCSSFNQSCSQDESYSYDKWTWGYKYNHTGVRDQKRMLTSPHGVDAYGTGVNNKVFAHLWE